MKTKLQILQEIRKHKTCSNTQLHRYLAAFNINPVGIRQRPQRYPDETTARILSALGFEASACPDPACPKKANGIPTLSELRAERTQARKARALRRAA
jgi:hypothetical protein